jgi:hypothetical protein
MRRLLNVVRVETACPGFRARGMAAFVALAVACAVLAPSLALADGDGVDDVWTQLVLAVVRVVLILLNLPPIHVCPC